MEKVTSSRATTVLACGAACLFTCVATLLIAKTFAGPALCQSSFEMPRLTFPSNRVEWDENTRLNIDEYNITAMITHNSERCYLQPLNRNGERRALQLLPEPLSDDMVESIGGVSAVHFCRDLPTYLLRDLETVHANLQERKKREAEEAEDEKEPATAESADEKEPAAAAAPAAAAGGKGAPAGGEPIWGGDLTYEQRTPRCMDIILDCGNEANIGQAQKCFTWINGVLLMKQQCDAPNKFSIYMTKPPGRILKIAQRQAKECLIRRQSGQRC